MAYTDVQYVLDKNGKPKGVIVPLKLWREIQSERETAYLLKSPAMKKRLLKSKNRTEGIPFEDLAWWIEKDRKQALRVVKLIEAAQRNPFQGIGQPEPLKHELSGCWSRRIDREHRLVYQVFEDKIRILACRYHY